MRLQPPCLFFFKKKEKGTMFLIPVFLESFLCWKFIIYPPFPVVHFIAKSCKQTKNLFSSQTLQHKWFVAMSPFFLGKAPSRAAPTVGVLRSYKLNSRSCWWYEPPLQICRVIGVADLWAAPTIWFVEAPQAPVAPTNIFVFFKILVMYFFINI